MAYGTSKQLMAEHMATVCLPSFLNQISTVLTHRLPGGYLAKEGNLSMSSYAVPGRSAWRKSKICPTNCGALAEIVNLPSQFVSKNPHFVIKDTHWIVWYLPFFFSLVHCLTISVQKPILT